MEQPMNDLIEKSLGDRDLERVKKYHDAWNVLDSHRQGV